MPETRPPAATRRQDQKARTRSLILENARNLFEEKGFERTTFRNVAAAAGVGLGTIFTHFPDKTTLLATALYSSLERTLAESLETFPGQAPVCDQFLHLARAFYTNYARRPALAKVLVREMLFVTDERVKALDSQIDERFLVLITELLKDAKQKGEIRSGVDCEKTAMIFFSHYLAALVWHFRMPSFDPEAVLETLKGFLDTTMAGIGTACPNG
jgi:AcrR family transcriptional regulator